MKNRIFMVSWTDKLTDTKNELEIYGSVDKTTSESYFTCKLNQKESYVITERDNKWQLENSFPILNLNSKQKDALSDNLGKIVDAYNKVHNLTEILKLK